MPFALMVGFPGPHCPYDPPPGALARIDPRRLPLPIAPTPESQSHHDAFVASYRRPWAGLDYTDLPVSEIVVLRHHYAALVERLDEDVATILAALDRSGQTGNTVVVFASDHGDYLGDFGLVGKTYFHEPSIRVPLIVADGRTDPVPQVVGTPVSLIDLFASVLTWAGEPLPPHADGRPLGEGDDDRVICGVTVHGAMARDRNWKLVRYVNGVEALFDLTADPQERDDVIDSHPRQRARLDLALTHSLLAGLAAGHADKRVPAAQSGPADGFYERGWVRPYPVSGED